MGGGAGRTGNKIKDPVLQRAVANRAARRKAAAAKKKNGKNRKGK